MKELTGADPGPLDGVPALSRYRRFVLAPSDLRGIQLTWSCELERELAHARLRPDLRLAAVRPTPLREDQLAYDEYERDGVRYFYRVRPSEPAAVEGELMSLLERARAMEADVVVAPELLVGAAFRDRIEAWLRPDQPPYVVVPGSLHTVRVSSDLPGRNVALIVVAGARSAEHEKFAPFEIGVGDKPIEDIRRRRSITVHVGAAVATTMSVLVCKDMLDPEVMRLLEALRVRLVLVPSLSPVTDGFRIEASSARSTSTRSPSA